MLSLRFTWFFALVVESYGHALLHEEPAATSNLDDSNRALELRVPRITPPPLVTNLRKRFSTDTRLQTCGWINGDNSSAVTCSTGRTCMVYTGTSSTFTVAMAGCCANTDYQNCGWALRCIDYEAYNAGKCDTFCKLDTFARKCTASSAPYCITWTYPAGGVKDYGCTNSSAQVGTVLQAVTDFATSISLITLGGSKVVGWSAETTAANPAATLSNHLGTLFGTTAGYAIPTSYGGGTSYTTPAPKTGLSIRHIVYIVIGGLIVLFVLVAAALLLFTRRRKAKRIAASQAAATATMASRPQSQFQPTAMAQQQGGMTPVVAGSQWRTAGPQELEQKLGPQVLCHEVDNVSPALSIPPTPAAHQVPIFHQAPEVSVVPTQSFHELNATQDPATHEQSSVHELGGGHLRC